MAVPFTFKWATDALAGTALRQSRLPTGCVMGDRAPIAMTIAYGGMRILMAAFTQLRDGLVRQGGNERGAQTGLSHLRAYA